MMNKVQKNYMMAKSALQTYENMAADIEKRYISENGIRNQNGEVPKRVYCIDNESVFDKANEETSKIIKESGLWKKINSERKKLKSSEENMIKFALSIAPVEMQETLEKGAKENYTIRKKLIDCTFRLDISTL